MIDRSHELSIARQARALAVARSSVYYKPRPASAEDLKLMRRLMNCEVLMRGLAARLRAPSTGRRPVTSSALGPMMPPFRHSCPTAVRAVGQLSPSKGLCDCL
jgi:hypothetical protein